MPDGLPGVFLGDDEAEDFVLDLGFSLALVAAAAAVEPFEGLAVDAIEAEDRAGARRALQPLRTLIAADELDIDSSPLEGQGENVETAAETRGQHRCCRLAARPLT